MPVHDDPKIEEMRLEGVRRGILAPELPTDEVPLTLEQMKEQMVQRLIGSLDDMGYKRSAQLEGKRMPHPTGRTPYSKPRPGVRPTRKR